MEHLKFHTILNLHKDNYFYSYINKMIIKTVSWNLSICAEHIWFSEFSVSVALEDHAFSTTRLCWHTNDFVAHKWLCIEISQEVGNFQPDEMFVVSFFYRKYSLHKCCSTAEFIFKSVLLMLQSFLFKSWNEKIKNIHFKPVGFETTLNEYW